MINIGIEMNPDTKAEWVAALRSGDYVQGRKVLAILEKGQKPKCCCLGVLCLLNKIEHTTDEHDHVEKFKFPGALDENAESIHYTSSEFFATLLRNESPFADEQRIRKAVAYSIIRYLARMNDADGKSFTEIADWIEANL